MLCKIQELYKNNKYAITRNRLRPYIRQKLTIMKQLFSFSFCDKRDCEVRKKRDEKHVYMKTGEINSDRFVVNENEYAIGNVSNKKDNM